MRGLIDKLLPLGRRSVLYGTHQFVWHPLTVYLAWCHLYGRPNWKEIICILIHDWGYWSKRDMDGLDGERHPEPGARLAGRLFGPEYHDLCQLHSRHYAKLAGRKPSKLCWADKYSIRYDPCWFYLLRATLSGEIKEYRRRASDYVPVHEPHVTWFNWVRQHLVTAALKQCHRPHA